MMRLRVVVGVSGRDCVRDCGRGNDWIMWWERGGSGGVVVFVVVFVVYM